MVKKTLIAIALVAFLASTAPAAIDVYYWGPISKDGGVKVDGNDDNVYWPYEYIALRVCAMPVLMEIGMYVEVQDCTDRKMKIKQVECSEIGKGGGDFPCYLGCESFSLRANFDVKLGTELVKIPKNADGSEPPGYGVIDKWEGFYDGGDVIPGDGADHSAKVCVRAWKAQLWKGGVGEEVRVGTLYVTAKPDV